MTLLTTCRPRWHLSAVLLAALLAAPALACAVPEPFAVSDIAAGPVVVVATVADYSMAQGEGFVTLDVTDVWKGTAPAHLTARWEVKLAEPPPETWDRPATVIAALALTEQGIDLVVETCGQAWLVPDTPEARAEIKGALLP